VASRRHRLCNHNPAYVSPGGFPIRYTGYYTLREPPDARRFGPELPTAKEEPMPFAKRKCFLDDHEVKYLSITRSKAYTAMDVAESAHVRGQGGGQDDRSKGGRPPGHTRFGRNHAAIPIGLHYVVGDQPSARAALEAVAVGVGVRPGGPSGRKRPWLPFFFLEDGGACSAAALATPLSLPGGQLRDSPCLLGFQLPLPGRAERVRLFDEFADGWWAVGAQGRREKQVVYGTEDVAHAQAQPGV